MQYPTSACLLQAWESAVSERSVRRPISWLSYAFGWQRPDLENLSLGERERLILQARCLLFGSTMIGLVECPFCGEAIECEIPVRALLEVPRSPVTPIPVKGVGFDLDVRMITAGDIEAASAADNIREQLFKRCVLKGDWQEDKVDEAIRVTGECLADADPLAHISLDIECPKCSVRISPRFDPWRFLWDEIEVWGNRLLQQIHCLASAYGWTEDQILALSASRRARYLHLVKR